MATTTEKKDLLIQQAFEAFIQQNYNQAEARLREAIALDPSAIEPRCHLANLCSLDGRCDEAASALAPLQENPQVSSEYRWFQFKSLWNVSDVAQAYPLARALFNSSNCSFERMKELADFARQSGFLYFYFQLSRKIGGEERRDGAWIAAAALFFRLVPRRFCRSFLQTVAERLKNRGRWRKLRILLTAASFADPNTPFWAKRMGQIDRITRDVYDPQFLREQLCYENVLRLNPGDEEALDGLLLTLNDRCAWQELARRFQQVPSESMIPWRKSLQAAVLANLRKVENAERLYRELETTECSDHARFCRGLLALSSSRWEEARELFQSEAKDAGYNFLNRFFLQIAHSCTNNPGATVDGQTILDSIPGELRAAPQDVPLSLIGGRCALCGWTGERRPLWKDTRSGWTRVRCPQCSMISVSPIPSLDEILSLYKQPKGKEKSLYLQAQREIDRYRAAGEAGCRQLPYFCLLTDWAPALDWSAFEKRWGADRRFLDVGCTAGDTVTLFEQCGWRAEGIDVDPDAVAYAQSKGLRVAQGTLESLESRLSTYHFVALVDVIEHVQDPADLLRRIYAILEPGGLFFLKTPCADSFPHRFLGDRWLESCEHLHFFSRKTLLQMLEQAGFQIVGLKQHFDGTTPYLHSEIWKQRFFPQVLDRWIFKTQSGDSIAVLVQKPEGKPPA